MPGAFLERSDPPQRRDLVAALGDRLPLWDRLSGALESAYGIGPEPLFFGRDSGWVVRYRRSGKSLAVLLPEPGRVRALVVLGPSVDLAAVEGSVGPDVRDAIGSARAYPDGRWLWLDVATEAMADDVLRLVAAKSPPPRRPRARPVGAGPAA